MPSSPIKQQAGWKLTEWVKCLSLQWNNKPGENLLSVLMSTSAMKQQACTSVFSNLILSKLILNVLPIFYNIQKKSYHGYCTELKIILQKSQYI